MVKKRFALSRLEWLTYAGPIANDAGTALNPTGDAGVGQIIQQLETNYGFSDAFLKQGTAANIKNYFGLNWVQTSGTNPGYWNYVHNDGGSGQGGSIMRVGRPLSISGTAANPQVYVQDAGREPDFFELLKAAIDVGSIGKTATAPSVDIAGGTSGSYDQQYSDDYRVDDAIIQMGVNIIDQSHLDNYCTAVSFNDGSGARFFHGIKNLPYLSALTHALVKVKQAVPASTTGTNTGVGALLQCPELWNPHGYNPNNVNETEGVVGPTNFRIYAVSGNAGVNNTIQLVGVIRYGAGNKDNQTQATVAKSPGYFTTYGFPQNPPETRTLVQSNTELDFTITRDGTGMAQFREPTILFQPSQLSSATGNLPYPAANSTNYGIIASNPAFFSNNGFVSAIGTGSNGIPPALGAGYVGFYLGAVPLYWYDGPPGNGYYWLNDEEPENPVFVTYNLQYQDANGNWVTYDQKYRTLGGSPTSDSEAATLCGGGDTAPDTTPSPNAWYSFLYPAAVTSGSGGGLWDSCFTAMDPRTSRFHMMKFTAGLSTGRFWTYPPYGGDTGVWTTGSSQVQVSYGWLNLAGGITVAMRNGTNDGATLICPVGLFPTAMGWNPGSVGLSSSGRFVTSTSSRTIWHYQPQPHLLPGDVCSK